MGLKYTAHVISHTHWDREWYQSFQQFRIRLVEMIDHLIDLMDTDADYRHFMLDGQTIVLEDYLEVRPERKEKLRKPISDGRILIGPWYNQPDEFLVSGESLIRNLLVGKQICEQFGHCMKVGYVPDAFGHTSQLPQVFQGFGIDNAVLFRGITDDQVPSEFAWRSPDGSEVLAIKLSDNNAYSNFFYHLIDSLKDDDTPLEEDQVIAKLSALKEECLNARPSTSHLLFMDGVDHVFPQFKTPQIIRLANESFDGLELKHSTLERFIDAVRNENPELTAVNGELRISNRAWKLQALLAGVLSSRMDIKQMNHRCETLLEKYVEPLCSWAWWMGGEYPKQYIDLAWKYLLQNSPHDSICTCSIDQVHKDMLYRYDQVLQICVKLMSDALSGIAGRIRPLPDEGSQSVALAVFNTLGHGRTDVVETYVDVPEEWNAAGARVFGPDGAELPCAVLGVRKHGTLEQLRHDIPRGRTTNRVGLAFVAEDIPPVGYISYRVDLLDRPSDSPATMLTGPHTAENEYLSISVEKDGSLAVTDLETGGRYRNCLVFEDCGDVGDGYNHVEPTEDRVIIQPAGAGSVSVVESNAVRAVFKLVTDVRLPISADRKTRSSEHISCKAETFVTLVSGLRRVDIRTVFTNCAKNHRLRVLFPTGLPAVVSHAEGIFDVVERGIAVPNCDGWKEAMPSTHPQKSFVDVSADGRGLTVIAKGLPEYEVKDDHERTVALTLMRANDGWTLDGDTRGDSQMQGEYTFEYSLYPHGGDWEEGRSLQQAHGFNVPLVAALAGSPKGILHESESFLEIDQPSFVLTSCKRSESGCSLVVRGWNAGGGEQTVRIGVHGAEKAHLVNLAEETLSEATVVDGATTFTVQPRQIQSLKIDRPVTKTTAQE